MIRFVKLFTFLWLLTSIVGFAVAEEPRLVIREGHAETSQIISIAFSPDGELFASGASDRSVKLWDVESGSLLNTFGGRSGSILFVDFSVSGDTLISASMDGTIEMIHVATGEVIKTFRDRGFYPTSASLHRESRILISSGRIGSEGYYKIWDLFTGEIIERVPVRDFPKKVFMIDEINAFASIESGSNKVLIRKIEGDLKEPIVLPEAFGAESQSLSVSSNGIICSSDDFGKTALWDSQNLKLIKTLRNELFAAEISPNGKLIAGLDESEQKVKILSALSGNVEREFSLEKCVATDIEFSPDSKFLLVGDDCGKITVYNVTEGAIVTRCAGSELKVVASAVSSDDKYGAFAVCRNNEENAVFILDFETGSLETFVETDLTQVNSIAINSENGKLAICGSGFFGESVFLFDIETQKLKNFGTFSEAATAADFSQSGDLFCFASEDTLKIYDLRKDILLDAVPSANGLRIIRSAFSEDNRKVAYGCVDGEVVVYDLQTEQSMFAAVEGNGKVLHISFTESGDSLAAVFENGTFVFKNIKTEKKCESRIPLKDRNPFVVASVIGNRLYGATRDNIIRVWNLDPEPKLVREFDSHHKNSVGEFALLEEDDLLISCGSEGVVSFWDLREENLHYSLYANREDLWAVASNTGFFDGTPNALIKMHWVIDNRPISFDSYYKDFFYPFLLEEIFGAEVKSVVNISETAIAGMPSPPQIGWQRIVGYDATEFEEYRITVQAEPISSPITTIYFYHNSKLLEKREFSGKDLFAFTENFDVRLLPGENILKAVAVDENGLRSNSVSREIFYRKPKEYKDLYVLAIGINEYGREDFELNYSIKDVEEFVKTIGQSSIYENVYVESLTDDEATKENVEKALIDISGRAHPRDAFIFYFAGHGESRLDESGENYRFSFLLYDPNSDYSKNNLDARFGSDELAEYVEKIKAFKQLLVLDACQSGSIVKDVADKLKMRYYDSKNLANISNIYGINIIASTLSFKPAYENADLEHGLFTYALLKGLRGEAADFSNTVTVNGLKLYLEKAVREKSARLNLNQQAYGSLNGSDFILLVIDKK